MDTGWRLTSTGSLLENYNISYFSKCLLDKYCRDKIAHAPSKKNLFYVDIKNRNFLSTKWSKWFWLFSPIPWTLPPQLQILHYKCCVQQIQFCYYIQGTVDWGLGNSEKQNLLTWRIDQHSTRFAVLYSGRGCGISTFRSVQRSLRWRYGWRYGWRSSGDNPTLTEKFGYMTSRGPFQPDFFYDSESCKFPTVAATMPVWWFFSVHTQSLKTTRFSDTQSWIVTKSCWQTRSCMENAQKMHGLLKSGPAKWSQSIESSQTCIWKVHLGSTCSQNTVIMLHINFLFKGQDP